MPNNPPAPEKAPTGYVLVTEGVVKDGDYLVYGFGGKIKSQRAESFQIGKPISSYVLRPPQPEPSERERGAKTPEGEHPITIPGFMYGITLEEMIRGLSHLSDGHSHTICSLARMLIDYKERERELEETLHMIRSCAQHYKTESRTKLRMTLELIYAKARKALERKGEE